MAESQFYNGSIVVQRGEEGIYRVACRSVDGMYDLIPVRGSIVYLKANEATPIKVYDLEHEDARTIGPNFPIRDHAVTYDVEYDDTREPLYEVPESVLVPFRPHDVVHDPEEKAALFRATGTFFDSGTVER